MTHRKLEVLVLEDEWVARNYLVELLEASDLAHVVGAVGTVDEAHALLTDIANEHRFDVVFVDVNLVGSTRDGLALVREWSAKPDAPAFALATAMKEYALEAYQLGVVDYVIKPFSIDRVRQCLTRLTKRLAPTPREATHRIVARRKRSLVFLELGDVWAFESADRLTMVHTRHGVFDIDLSLAAIEVAFAGHVRRVHRNWLVSTAHIRELQRDDGDSTLIVGSGYGEGAPCVRVPVARERSHGVREWLLAAAPGVRRR